MPRYIEIIGNGNKAPVESPKKAFYTSYNNLTSAAELLNKTTVVLDFDKPEDINIVEKILTKYPTKAVKTKRGYHLYFKVPQNLKIKSWVNRPTAIGLMCDFRREQAIIKLDGIERPCFNKDNLLELPKILYPYFTTNDIDLINMAENSGRNTELYKRLKYFIKFFPGKELMSLASKIQETMRHPLPNEEVETMVNNIINDHTTLEKESVWETDKNGNKKISIIKVADKVIKDLNIKSCDKFLYFKHNQKFIRDIDILQHKVMNITGVSLTKNQDSELLHQIKKKTIIDNIDSKNTVYPIILKNGYQITRKGIDIITGEFTPFYLDINYNKKAYDKNVDDFLNWFVSYDKETRILIEDILGHIIMTAKAPQHAYFFVGSDGKNGKSTFLEMLNNFVGELAESLSLDDISNEKHLIDIRDKLLNTADDIDNTYQLTSSKFKNIVAGNKTKGWVMYKGGAGIYNRATLLFTCNTMPKFKDKSGGMERRIRIVPCNAIVKKVDPDIDDKLSTDNAKSYLLKLALEGQKRIIMNGGMTEPNKCMSALSEYFIDSDSVSGFIKDCEENGIEIENKPVWKIHILYDEFCKSNNHTTLGQKVFTKELKKHGYKSKNQWIKEENKTGKCYVLEKKGVIIE